MKDDAVVVGIEVVAVSLPVLGLNMDLHLSLQEATILDGDDGAAEQMSPPWLFARVWRALKARLRKA